jgi:hypothetical protein
LLQDGRLYGEPSIVQGPTGSDPYKMYTSKFKRKMNTGVDEEVTIRIAICAQNIDPATLPSDDPVKISLQGFGVCAGMPSFCMLAPEATQCNDNCGASGLCCGSTSGKGSLDCTCDGGGGGSVGIRAYLPLHGNKFAMDIKIGDDILLLNETRDGTKIGTVTKNRISTQKLYTMVSESGIRLTLSDNTPITLRDGSMINSTQVLNHELPVQDENGFRWEKIVQLLDAGTGEVATISCEDQCYGAGDEIGKYIWTHNMMTGK